MEEKATVLEMMVTGTFDLFEIRMEQIEPAGAGLSVLDAPYSVTVRPESVMEPLRQVLDGVTVFGHMPFINSDGLDLIVAPLQMIAAMKRHDYDVTLMPNFQRLVEDYSKVPASKDLSAVDVIY